MGRRWQIKSQKDNLRIRWELLLSGFWEFAPMMLNLSCIMAWCCLGLWVMRPLKSEANLTARSPASLTGLRPSTRKQNRLNVSSPSHSATGFSRNVGSSFKSWRKYQSHLFQVNKHSILILKFIHGANSQTYIKNKPWFLRNEVRQTAVAVNVRQLRFPHREFWVVPVIISPFTLF